MRPVPVDDATPLAPLDFLPPRTWLRDERDARHYTRLTLSLVSVLYAALAIALAGWMPATWLWLIVPLVYLRLALALHELLHVCPAESVPAFHRLTLLFESPLALGYREHRAIHFAHHRFTATDHDPEQYQIVGGPVRAFLMALISPEHALVRWIRTYGFSSTLIREAAIRAVLFVAVAAIAPRVFLVYWLALRVSVGIASFVFHHVLHNHQGELGTFRLPGSPWFLRLLAAAFGREALTILTEHERHHLWPRVRARDLPLLPVPHA